jgi:phosphate acetyltransferase
VIPQERILSDPTLTDVCERVHGTMIAGDCGQRQRVSNVMIGAMNASNALSRIEHQTLLIVSGDRDDIVLAAIAGNEHRDQAHGSLVGLVLSESLTPGEAVLAIIRQSKLPVFLSPMDSYTIANRIHSMTVKTLPGDSEKIGRIQQLVAEHVDIDRILEKLSG